MKTIFTLIIIMCFNILLIAQESKTVDVTPGNLSTLLTEEEKNTVTNLTITGIIDARDFKTMRDSMPNLAVLDISEVKIEAYYEAYNMYEYPENTIPRHNPDWSGSWINYSLSDKTTLTTVILPASLTDIGNYAFRGCTGLLEIDIPSLVVNIGGGAFYGCTSLAECTIPSSVVTIRAEAFFGCSSLSSIELPSKLRMIEAYTFSECTALASVIIPATVNRIYDYAFSLCSSLESIDFPSSLTMIGSFAFYQCTALTSVTIPSSVTSINGTAFGGCSNVTTIILPATLKQLESEAFGYCTSLTSVYSYAPVPLQLNEVNENQPGIFTGVDKANVTLYVPKGSKELYEEANEWEDFPTIVEMPGFSLSDLNVILEASEGEATVEMVADGEWTASTDQSWLTVSPSSGSGKATLALTAEDNTAVSSRLAKVVVTITDGLSQDITVIQKGVSKTIDVETAGTLYTYFSEDELTGITQLILTGEIDARDFKLIRDQMPYLEVLDLGATTIEAYSGPDGTDVYSTEYEEDEIPNNALDNYMDERKGRLTTLVLPESVTVLGYEAFANCRALKGIEIPSSVIVIRTYAFDACTSITELILPSSVITIQAQAFRGCRSLNNIELPSSITEIGSAAFEGTGLTSVSLPPLLTIINHRLFYSCTELETVEIGPAVTEIGSEAFFYCISLKSINIPASVTSILSFAFTACDSLTSVYSYPLDPPVPDEYGMGFSSNVLEEAILYVPIGTKEVYASANEWEDFAHIVEMGEFSLEETEVSIDAGANSEVMVKLHSSIHWTASSDQEWLTVDPTSGGGGHWLTLTADANQQAASRTAIVTIKAEGADSLTITVTQHGITVGIEELESGAKVKYYPNPFTHEMAIEVANVANSNVSVEIYNLSGQRVKSLARAQKEAKISIVWDGKDELGQLVPEGVYILKVNEAAWQVVKE